MSVQSRGGGYLGIPGSVSIAISLSLGNVEYLVLKNEYEYENIHLSVLFRARSPDMAQAHACLPDLARIWPRGRLRGMPTPLRHAILCDLCEQVRPRWHLGRMILDPSTVIWGSLGSGQRLRAT
jgi:hypothetical protein